LSEDGSVPIYEYGCRRCGAAFERLYPTISQAQAACPSCPGCGAGEVERLVSEVTLSGRVEVGPGRAAYPYTWEQTHGGDPEVLRYWRRRIEKEMREEQNDPELSLRREEVARRRFGLLPEERTARDQPSPAGWEYVGYVHPKTGAMVRPVDGGRPRSTGHTHPHPRPSP
jgi:putative FmdB family regulatory protein